MEQIVHSSDHIIKNATIFNVIKSVSNELVVIFISKIKVMQSRERKRFSNKPDLQVVTVSRSCKRDF